jgi:hypothetical protein
MATQHTHQQILPEPLIIVLGALADIGISSPRPAPGASLAFIPRQLRQEGARHG